MGNRLIVNFPCDRARPFSRKHGDYRNHPAARQLSVGDRHEGMDKSCNSKQTHLEMTQAIEGNKWRDEKDMVRRRDWKNSI